MTHPTKSQRTVSSQMPAPRRRARRFLLLCAAAVGVGLSPATEARAQAPDYQVVPGQIIYMNNDETLGDATLEQCKARCTALDGRGGRWNCKGFEFSDTNNDGTGSCNLSELSCEEAGRDCLQGDRNYDYYEKRPGLTAGPTTPATGGASGRTIEADRSEVRRGALTRVYVRLRNPGGVANMDYELRYDPAVVRPEGEPLAGNLLRGRAIFESNPAERGRIRIGFAGSDGLDRDGTVTVIPFRATGAPGARTALTLSTPIIEDAQGRTLSIDRVDGAIEILREGGATGDGTGGGDRDGTGDGTGAGAAGGPLPDCNNDGTINSLDADCALEMSVGTRPVDMGMDADGNGEVTSGDARVILQRALGARSDR